MRTVDILRKKRDGGELNAAEIAAFIEAAARGTWPEYQLSALLMAICVRGMTPQETANLTRSMTDSGKRLDLSDMPGPKVDKHSTGGVGDKTSLILAPLVAACGVLVPMMSGRGLGHTGGTLDKLESIPGFRVNLNEAEFRDALRNVGLGMIGQTADVAPADKALYALRDVTGTVESVPLITASILSKKLSEGIDALVLDVKCGCGAFMKTLADARILAESLVRVATLNGLRCEAIITSMDTPLGMAIGNTLEVIESIETLKGNGPADLEELSVALAARMVRLAGCAPTDAVAESLVRKAIQSGEGVERFRKMVAQQGGDPRIVDDYSLLPQAPHRTTIQATRSGWITRIDAEAIGIAAMLLGAGRTRSDDTIDPAVGIVLRVKPGDSVRVGDAVLEVHHRGVSLPVEIQSRIESGYTIGETSVGAAPSILEYLT